ncbi:MAG: OFA family MFS transporter [Candidatus Auribacterota bacterium]|jgi:OFA family oxalate/formate antiporter-like MFS transporter|nr:OFA family MFS transporter [Candidatus Auribacterota bacterium]
MSEKKVINRWFIVIGALGIQLCLGSLYAWSIFVNPLKEQYGYTTTQAQAIFSANLAAFALAMIFAGRLQDKIGPRITALIGSVLFGSGYFLSGFTDGSFQGLLCTMGVIGGIGIGFCYVSPIAALVKWFPDKRGFITGIAVAGYGAGALVFAQAVIVMIEKNGVMSAFFLLGAIFFAVCIPSALILCNPPEKWTPKGWSAQLKKNAPVTRDFSWKEMIATSQFWMLWVMFIAGAAAGLLVISNLKPFGVHNGLSTVAAGSAVGILAIFNGAGRIVWGIAYDKLGRPIAMSLMFFLQGIMMFALIKMGSTPALLAVASSWVGFNYGGIFALFPSSTADFFGTKFIGVNYAFVFTAYGIAGIIGPLLGGKIFDMTGSYLYAFIPAGVMCLIAAALALATTHPKDRHHCQTV